MKRDSKLFFVISDILIEDSYCPASHEIIYRFLCDAGWRHPLFIEECSI